MIELLKQLDEANGPSRTLDFAIWRSLPPDGGDRSDPHYAPRFTRSVDAARTLLRSHYLWELKQGIECRAIVWWLEKDWDDTGAPTGYSTTHPALALTKAALLARAIEDRIPPSPADRNGVEIAHTSQSFKEAEISGKTEP